MNRFGKLAALVLATLSPGVCLARSEIDQVKPVQQQERSMVVEYKSGEKIKYAVVFVGAVHVNRFEDGNPSTLDPFHPFDDRKCHWTVTPSITRQTFIVLPDGERAEKRDLAFVYNVPFSNQGSDFVLMQLRPENCSDAQARFDSDVNNGVASVNRDMSAVLDRAYNELREFIKKKEGVAQIVGG